MKLCYGPKIQDSARSEWVDRCAKECRETDEILNYKLGAKANATGQEIGALRFLQVALWAKETLQKSSPCVLGLSPAGHH